MSDTDTPTGYFAEGKGWIRNLDNIPGTLVLMDDNGRYFQINYDYPPIYHVKWPQYISMRRPNLQESLLFREKGLGTDVWVIEIRSVRLWNRGYYPDNPRPNEWKKNLGAMQEKSDCVNYYLSRDYSEELAKSLCSVPDEFIPLPRNLPQAPSPSLPPPPRKRVRSEYVPPKPPPVIDITPALDVAYFQGSTSESDCFQRAKLKGYNDQQALSACNKYYLPTRPGGGGGGIMRMVEKLRESTGLRDCYDKAIAKGFSPENAKKICKSISEEADSFPNSTQATRFSDCYAKNRAKGHSPIESLALCRDLNESGDPLPPRYPPAHVEDIKKAETNKLCYDRARALGYEHAKALEICKLYWTKIYDPKNFPSPEDKIPIPVYLSGAYSNKNCWDRAMSRDGNMTLEQAKILCAKHYIPKDPTPSPSQNKETRLLTNDEINGMSHEELTQRRSATPVNIDFVNSVPLKDPTVGDRELDAKKAYLSGR